MCVSGVGVSSHHSLLPIHFTSCLGCTTPVQQNDTDSSRKTSRSFYFTLRSRFKFIMVAGSAKKSPAKSDRTPTRARRSASKTLKEGNSPAASIGSKASNKSPVKTTSKKKSPRDASFSHRLPTNQQRRGNGRVSGRSLIMWNRRLKLPFLVGLYRY